MLQQQPVHIQRDVLLPNTPRNNNEDSIPIATLVSPTTHPLPSVPPISASSSSLQPTYYATNLHVTSPSSAVVVPQGLVNNVVTISPPGERSIVDIEAFEAMNASRNRKEKCRKGILTLLGFVCFVIFILPSTFGQTTASNNNMTTANRSTSSGGGGGCFPRGTRVVLADGGTKRIEDIMLDDFVQSGGRVTGLFCFKKIHQQLFNLSGVIVTGSHKIFENNRWRYSSESKRAQPVELPMATELFNLDTEQHRLVMAAAPHLVFADFTEVNDEKNLIGELELRLLNNAEL